MFSVRSALGNSEQNLRRLVTGFPPHRSGFYPKSSHMGQIFSEYFGFPCQFSFHRLLHNHLSFYYVTAPSQWEPPKILLYPTAENQFYYATGRRLPEIFYYPNTATNFIGAENASTNFNLFCLTAATKSLCPLRGSMTVLTPIGRVWISLTPFQ
jgi:hypothetical protein